MYVCIKHTYIHAELHTLTHSDTYVHIQIHKRRPHLAYTHVYIQHILTHVNAHAHIHTKTQTCKAYICARALISYECRMWSKTP